MYQYGRSMFIVSSLNSTLLTPYNLILDIAYQLSDDLYSEIKKKVFESYFEVKTANDWINLEAFGNMSAMRAQALCQILNDYCIANGITQLKLYIYLDGFKLTSDNIFTLIFMAENLNNIRLNVNMSDAKLAEQTEFYAIKSNDNIILSSFHERELEEFTDLELTKSELIERKFSLLAEMGFLFQACSSDKFFESKQIVDDTVGYAWSILKLGSYEIATNMLSQVIASEAISASEKEKLVLHLQLIRFHSHQYVDVAQQIYPEFRSLDEQSISYLHYIKAYSATLSRNPVIAGDSFKACDIHKDMAITAEFNLYQLNIFALYNVIINNIDVAYDLEMKIESYIQDHDIKTVGLKYVNYINIARLFKKLEKYDVSLAYYHSAYDELSGGGYTASDYIYYNMNLGSLFEAWGQTDKAATCWVKAALHWLVSDNPYALAWRPKIILCGEKTSDLNQVLSLEKVTRFFIHKIETLIELDAVEKSYSQPLEFVLNKSKIYNAEAYVLDDLIVYTSLNEASRPFGPRKQLQNFMSRVIRSLFNIDKNANTICIDYLSDDVIRKTKIFWPLSMIHNCERWNINNENVSQAELDRFKSTVELSVSLSALIHTVSEKDGALNLNYHRSFMDKQLVNQAEIDLVDELQSCKSLPLSKLSGDINVINLLYKNVLELKFEDKDF